MCDGVRGQSCSSGSHVYSSRGCKLSCFDVESNIANAHADININARAHVCSDVAVGQARGKHNANIAANFHVVRRR